MAHASWRENREGELFFVEAESTGAGWEFSERSTYEVCWYKVRPKGGWIEKANAIVAAQDPADRAQGARQAAGSQIELGNYCDNASALAVALWKINRGDTDQGLAMLNQLRAHILVTSEEKSRRLLLPAVEEAIESEFRRQREAQRMARQNDLPPAFASVGAAERHQSADMVSRFKLHLIDVVAIVTALTWTHAMLVREINTLPGFAAYPAGTNVVAGSVLAVVFRLVSKTARG